MVVMISVLDLLHVIDVPWMLVSPDYLKNLKSVNAVSSWRNFLQKLGVHNTIAVRKFTENIPEVSLDCL